MRKYQIVFALFLTVLLCALTHDVAAAEATGNLRRIRGIVTDGKTSETLIGASVLVKDQQTGVVTGLDGSYSLNSTPGNSIVLVCSYIGYDPIEKKVAWDGKEDLKVDFALNPSSVNLKEVVVSGRMNKETEMSARLTEKISANVMNVVGAKTIQASPDLTVANVLQRVSGVSVEKDGQGEGKYPVVRGMDKRYNYTLINGLKVSSPDDKNRYVPMDIFPADLLERLEVSKSLTPDMEGDAIGGVMNMVMKSAPDQPSLKGNVAIGYSQMLLDQKYRSFDKGSVQMKSPAERHGSDYVATSDDFSRGNYSYKNKRAMPDIIAGITAGTRLGARKQLGMMLAASFQNTYRGSNSTFFTLSPQPRLGNTPDFNDMQLRRYSTQQQRIGVNSKVDYQFSQRHKLTANYLFVKLDQYQNRQMTDTVLYHRTGFGSGEVIQSDRSRVQKQTIHNVSLRGDHQFTDAFGMNWTGSYSTASNNLPDWGDLQSRHQVTTDNGTVSRTPSYLDNFTRRWQHNSDRDYTGMFNLVYSTGKKITSTLSTGMLFRHKRRSNYMNVYTLTPDLINNEPQVFDNIYDAQFSFHPASEGRGSIANPNTYTSQENITAWYAQAKLGIQKLEILGGLRMEHTSQRYKTVMDESFEGRSGNSKYTDLLPALHLKYKLNDKQNLRMSYYMSISRPGFFEVIPYNIAGEFYTETGNPNLKHTVAHNIDLRYEFFPNGGDQLLVGAFYKRIKNPIEQVLTVNRSVLELRPDNFGTATNYGWELVLTKFFHYVGVSFNYTYTMSDITTDKRLYYRDGEGTNGQVTTQTVRESRPLQGQSKHIGNLSLMYKNPKIGLDAQLSAVYTGKRIQQLSPYAGLDYWLHPYTTVDFSVEKKIGKMFVAYAKIANLLNTPTQVEVKKPAPENAYIPAQTSPDKITVQKSYYKPAYQLGVRVNL